MKSEEIAKILLLTDKIYRFDWITWGNEIAILILTVNLIYIGLFSLSTYVYCNFFTINL